jgi:hypothetical protein
MAIHGGFQRGEHRGAILRVVYSLLHEPSASTDVVGTVGRIGDTRTHIFRIDTEPNDYHSFFTSDGTAVAKDDRGQAAVTMDFVCFRCHNGIGNAGVIDSFELASGVASDAPDQQAYASRLIRSSE